MKIKIISGSVREGRSSHRVALFLHRFIVENGIAEVEILDLKSYAFPVFEERLQYQQHPSAAVLEFSGKIREADGILIVTPEYNGGYPAALKNAIDLLYTEWKRKPIAVATVSDGPFGGTQVITSLLFSLWKIGAWVVPATFPTTNVNEAYSEDGIPADQHTSGKRAKRFLEELLWAIAAKMKMQS